MNKLLLTLLIGITFISNLFAQITIKGQVFYNNSPQENVTVFLNNTTKGTLTNTKGEFNLTLQPGAYQLIISYIGFKTIKQNIDTAKNIEPLIFNLTEEVHTLNEVVISKPKKGNDWQYNYSKFFKEFIGSSKFSKLCTIENPNVIFFDYDPINQTLTAWTTAPLHIKNKALGYDIFYDLEHFTVDNGITKYSGYAYFKALEDKNKQKKWQKNRLKAYNGSQIHFFKSVLKNKIKEEGFVVSQFYRKKEKNTNKTKFVDYLYKSNLTQADIINKENNKIYLQFKDNLKVTYLKEKEEKGYIMRGLFKEPRKALPQSSNIIPLTERSILTQKGILENPLNIIYEEYWSYEKFAHSLPLNYEPM